MLFTNGDRETIRANEGFYFGSGASILTEARTMEIELSAIGGGLTYHLNPACATPASGTR